jgi:hypothetical protein
MTGTGRSILLKGTGFPLRPIFHRPGVDGDSRERFCVQAKRDDSRKAIAIGW